uniref:Uncharacterized protein n=1 Tax=Cacopsylla melanoneura TaxID=428564 RepID=A0A8D8XFJ4_9HEMI
MLTLHNIIMLGPIPEEHTSPLIILEYRYYRYTLTFVKTSSPPIILSIRQPFPPTSTLIFINLYSHLFFSYLFSSYPTHQTIVTQKTCVRTLSKQKGFLAFTYQTLKSCFLKPVVHDAVFNSLVPMQKGFKF